MRWQMTLEDAQKRGNEWLCADQSFRQKYDAMLRYGISGFSADEAGVLSEALERLRVKQSRSEDSESDYTDQDGQTESKVQDNNGPRSDADSELNGFLEHQEESIAPAASDDQFDFSGLSEDLDMASRLGGETLQ